jgi:hypothetical protein
MEKEYIRQTTAVSKGYADWACPLDIMAFLAEVTKTYPKQGLHPLRQVFFDDLVRNTLPAILRNMAPNSPPNKLNTLFLQRTAYQPQAANAHFFSNMIRKAKNITPADSFIRSCFVSLKDKGRSVTAT